MGSFSFTDSGRLTMLETPTYLFNEVAYRPAKQVITPNQLRNFWIFQLIRDI